MEVVLGSFVFKPTSYRLLEVGEFYQIGDLYEWRPGLFEPVHPQSGLAGNVRMSHMFLGKYWRAVYPKHPFLDCPSVTCNEGRVS